MTPEERRELADRLVERANRIDSEGRYRHVLAAAAVRSRNFVVVSAGAGKLLVDAGEEFEVPDEVGAALLEQVGNYVLVEGAE